jgi:hypothetical protein
VREARYAGHCDDGDVVEYVYPHDDLTRPVEAVSGAWWDEQPDPLEEDCSLDGPDGGLEEGGVCIYDLPVMSVVATGRRGQALVGGSRIKPKAYL